MASLKPKQVGKGKERQKIRIAIPFRSYPVRNRKFQENCKKLLLWLHFKPKQVGKGQERAKIKIIVPFHCYPMRNKKLQNNSKKILKIKKFRYDFF